MTLKKFNKFFEEATVKGNPSFPGEGDKKPGEKNYLSDVEKRAKERLGIRPQDISTRIGGRPVPSQKEMRLGRRMMELMNQSLNWTRGKEEKLSELASSVFLNLYGDLVDRYEIELDIKVIKPGKVKQFMDESEEDDDQPEEWREVVEKDIIDEINKRKFANLIIQGEAKNTKHILHSDEVKTGLEEIYGKEDGKKVFELWDELSKIADQLDWIIPADVRSEMMEKMPDGLAGASFVDWKPKEKTEEEGEEYSEWTGEEDEESMYSEEEYEEEPMERFDSTPIIRARGIDFPMLLHESVKGLFELLSLGGIPEEERVAGIVLSNTGISDEPEDWKYGPEVASDLRDFVNKSPRIDEFPNIREELFKLLIDKTTMPTSKFIQLMRGILSETDEARKEIDKYVNKIADSIKEVEDKYRKDMEEYERQMREWEESKRAPKEPTEKEEEDEIEKLIKNSGKKEEGEEDFSKLSQKEIMDEIDAALDEEDYKRVEFLSKYLKKESKQIFLREIKRINESKKRNTK